MAEVKQSGIFRHKETGHAYWWRRGYVVPDDIAEDYALDPDADLSDEQRDIIAMEQGAPSPDAIAFKQFGTPGENPVTADSIHTAPGSDAPVTVREVTTTGEAPEPEPVPVAPGGRRKRQRAGVQTPEQGRDTPDDLRTPEDGDDPLDTREDDDEDSGE